MSKVSLLDACNITTGKKDSNAAVENGLYPFFTCAPEPLKINSFCFDDDVILLAGNNAGANFHCQRYKGKFDAYQRTYVFTAKEGYCLDYVYYSLLINLKHYAKKSQGSQTKFLTLKILADFEIDDVTYLEQLEVSRKLRIIDDKIINNNQIIRNLEEMVITLYNYWFLQFEFPNENGKSYKSSGRKMVWNEELKREIPEGWKARKIVNILNEADKSKVQVNEAKEKGGYPFFTSGNSILSYDEFFVDGFNIFLNTGGNPDIKAYMGKCAYSTDTWCISANEYSYVLYYYLLKLMPQFEQLFFAGSGLKHLQKKALKNKYILLPDIRVLKIFNDSCVSIWKKVANYYIQNQELSSLRDFLLPLLLNGQVTFKENKLWIG